MRGARGGVPQGSVLAHLRTPTQMHPRRQLHPPPSMDGGEQEGRDGKDMAGTAVAIRFSPGDARRRDGSGEGPGSAALLPSSAGLASRKQRR